MRRGKVGELYFERLPGFSHEVMIPALYAQTITNITMYIEDHFDIAEQEILKKELENDKGQLW